MLKNNNITIIFILNSIYIVLNSIKPLVEIQPTSIKNSLNFFKYTKIYM